MNHNRLFSGIGGFDLTAELYGITLSVIEMDKEISNQTGRSHR